MLQKFPSAKKHIDIKGQIVVFDYFCAKREGIFEVLCISKGKLTDFRAKRAENFKDLQGQIKVFWYFLRAKREENF